MKIWRYDRGRYLCESERPGVEPYLCDLEDPQFPLGRCECEDNRIRIQHPMNNGEQPIRATCKHLRRLHSQLAHAQSLCEQLGSGYDPALLLPLHGA